MLRAFGITDKGRVRPTNEDRFGIDPTHQLCVVADGMGGHNAGEVAARIAVDTITASVARAGGPMTLWPFGFDPAISEAGNVLRHAVHAANVEVREAASARYQYSGMGTTIVAAMVRDGRLTVAHVGDSRLYLFKKGSGARPTARPGDGCSASLHLLTRDDSWMASMLATNPGADRAMLQNHPMRHALTSVVGTRPRTRVHVSETMLEPGDLIALTTDGVHNVVEDSQIERMMAETGNAEEIAKGLVRSALAQGTRDNCTAVVAEYCRG